MQAQTAITVHVIPSISAAFLHVLNNVHPWFAAVCCLLYHPVYQHPVYPGTNGSTSQGELLLLFLFLKSKMCEIVFGVLVLH